MAPSAWGVLKSSSIAASNRARKPRSSPGSSGAAWAPDQDARLRPLDRVAIVRAEHPEPQRVRAVALDDLADREDVAERLRHLLGTQVDEAIVDPVARERLARAD